MGSTIYVGADYSDLILTLLNEDDDTVIDLTGQTSVVGRLRLEAAIVDKITPRNATVVNESAGRVDWAFDNEDFVAADHQKKVKFWIESDIAGRKLITNERYFDIVDPEVA